MVEWIADHTVEGGSLSCSWKDYNTAFIQYFPPLLSCVNRDTWSALSMDNCGSFHKYAQSFQRQAVEVCPSEAEKIHNFKCGLTSALQNAVLLDTTTKEPWTEVAPLLKFATSFANEMQGKRSHTIAHVDNAGRSRRDSRGQRSERAARFDRGQAPASSEKDPRTMWCRAERRCDNCLQQGHIRASCPNAATTEQQYQALQAYAARKKSTVKATSPKPHLIVMCQYVMLFHNIA